MRQRLRSTVTYPRLVVLLGVLVSCQAHRQLPEVLQDRSCSPRHVHLALTEKKGELRAIWQADAAGCDTKIKYGFHLNRKLKGQLSVGDPPTEKTYDADDMCAKPAASDTFSPPNIYSAVMRHLDAGEQYFYQIGEKGSAHYFRAPQLTDQGTRFRFLIYGDMGVTHTKKEKKEFGYKKKCPGSEEVADRVRKEVESGTVDLVVHVGDIAYADGRQDEWDNFMHLIEPIASRVPYMVGVGNHEYDYHTGKEHVKRVDPSGYLHPYEPDWGNYGNDSGGECGVSVSKRFQMPGTPAEPTEWAKAAALNASLESEDSETQEEGQAKGLHSEGPNAPFWYSFEYGSVHFTMISTEHDLTKGSDQYKWLVEELASVDRCRTPWLVVGMHRPMYVVYPHKSNRIVGEHLRHTLEDLFERHEVDLVVSGHVHSYYRTCNVKALSCVAERKGGMVHIVVGSAGHKLSDIAEKPDRTEWLAASEIEFGYGRVSVDASSSLLFEFIRAEDGKVRDSVRLSSARNEARGCPPVVTRADPNLSDLMISGFGKPWCGSSCQMT